MIVKAQYHITYFFCFIPPFEFLHHHRLMSSIATVDNSSARVRDFTEVVYRLWFIFSLKFAPL